MYTPVKCPDKKIQKLIDTLPKLDPKAKKLWVDALLSGEYKQTKFFLKKDQRRQFCCLGVASDVAISSNAINGKWIKEAFLDLDTKTTQFDSLHESVSNWLGTDLSDPQVYYEGKLYHLSSLNDLKKLDFEMIAGLIINQL